MTTEGVNEEKQNTWAEHLNATVKNKALTQKTWLFYSHFVDHLYNLRIQKNNDAIICVCGERNSGKSSFAIVTALILKMRYPDVNFSFKNISYGLGDMQKMIKTITQSRRTVYIFDEMIDFAYSREAMSTLNKTISKILIKARKLNNIYFFCIPRFRDLDSSLRNSVVNFWIEVFWKSRYEVEHSKKFAMAALFRKNKNVLSADPWGVSGAGGEMKMASMARERVFTPKDHLKFLKRLPSYIETFTFPPIPKPLEEIYEGGSREQLGIGAGRAMAAAEGESLKVQKLREIKERIIKKKADLELLV